MIEGNAGFAYKRAIKYAGKNSGWSHIDDDDILQSAMHGLIDAVDKYDPTKGFSFTTYAHFWIVKRIDEQISSNHWNTMRPPRNMMRSFLYRKFDYDEAGEYMGKFMSQSNVTDVSTDDFIDHGYGFAELKEAIDRCGLTDMEKRIFEVLYGENRFNDDLIDLEKKFVVMVEETMLEKIRNGLE